MESPEVKPIVPADDIPNKRSLAVPLSVGKVKQSRYEDVWPEDVHAAFMEAVALYPPMGKRRLKYYRVSTHDHEHLPEVNRTKSFGRCQLIQSYILEKTGKDRSRKQVSSHLQRLKKIHKDNPDMRPLFSERSQAPLGHCSASVAIPSDDVFASIAVSTRHIKTDPGLTAYPQNADIGVERLSTFSCESNTPPLNSGSFQTINYSTSICGQPTLFPSQEFLSPAPQQWPGTLHPSDSDYLSELQDALLFKDAMSEGSRSSAFNTSAFSISMRRLTSKLPARSRLADSGPMTNFCRSLHSPGFQPTPSYQWNSHDTLDGVSNSCGSSLTSAQEAFYTPFFPLHLISPEKQRLDYGFASEWMWPQNPDIPIGVQDGPFETVRLRYPSATPEYNPSCPDMGVITPGFCGPSPQSDPSRLPRGISSHAVASPATISESVAKENPIDLHRQSPESPENPTSPLVVRPTPMYPTSYIHSNISL